MPTNFFFGFNFKGKKNIKNSFPLSLCQVSFSIYIPFHFQLPNLLDTSSVVLLQKQIVQIYSFPPFSVSFLFFFSLFFFWIPMMIPPPAPIILDAQAISGITGSISLACWIIVFAPQIYENFTRKSSEGLSLTFIILWLAGDVFNVLGAVLQGVLPTMIVLAVYYTLADIVLLWQCLIYGNGTSNVADEAKNKPDLYHLSPANPMNENLPEHHHHHHHNHHNANGSARASSDMRQEDLEAASTQLLPTPPPPAVAASSSPTSLSLSSSSSVSTPPKSSNTLTFLLNSLMVAIVIVSGIVGWYISYLKDQDHQRKHPGEIHKPQDLVYDPLAQTFGWLCAILYLGSRVPQIVLNYERKSCEGISFMFFLFACLGNLTYVISILSIDMSWHYLWVNSSWLAGSLGTLGLDFTIFIQFFLYNKDFANDDEGDEESSLCNSACVNAGISRPSSASEPLLNNSQGDVNTTSYGANRNIE